MGTLRSHEGYMLIDHRNSPGVPDEVVMREGLPAGAGQRVFESATFTCSHCEAIVIMNPDRSRERGYCRKCDHYVCDRCETERVKTGVCYPYKARIADLIEQSLRQPVTTEAFIPKLIIP